jgi:DNA repair protein RadA/Sms
MSRADLGVDRRLQPRVEIEIAPSTKIVAADKPRIETGMKDFDDVLGGGLTYGASLLFGAEPGTGKSTLMRQVLKCAANRNHRGFYLTAEEHASQARMQMDRLGAVHREVFVSETRDFRKAIDLVYKWAPRIVVVDSIQKMRDPKCKGAPGGRLQLDAIMELCKTLPDKVAFIFIGHSTKTGRFAGTQDVKHDVDQVMWMMKDTMDPNSRPLMMEKNRFGATNIERTLIMGTRGFCNYGKDDPRHGQPDATDANVEEEGDSDD